MRKTHPVSKLLERIVWGSQAFSQIQMKQMTVLGTLVTIRNFWWFDIEFDPIVFSLSFPGRTHFAQGE
jgi:hypothetical protein